MSCASCGVADGNVHEATCGQDRLVFRRHAPTYDEEPPLRTTTFRELISVSGFKFSALYALDYGGRVYQWNYGAGAWAQLPDERVPWVKPEPKKKGRKKA